MVTVPVPVIVTVLPANHAGPDTILDFQQGQDLIGLSKGLTFNQLKVTQGDISTTIEIASNGEVLASLPGLRRSVLTASDFISI